MTKQEKIQEAYGEYWELFSVEEQENILKNNGWVMKFNHPLHWEMCKFFEIETSDYGVGTSWRPKSLQGIENNNGWIKIESENDLPKETIDVFWMDKTQGIICGKYYAINDYDNIKFLIENATHYQPITKPQSPIY